MMPYPFECPMCTQQYWEENSVKHDEEFDDSICYNCFSELQAERRDLANSEKGE